MSLETLFRPPKGPGTRNSPEKMNSGWELNRKFFVRELFKLKSNIQGRFRQADIARDINKSKMRTSKFGHFWPKTMDLLLRKKSISYSFKSFQSNPWLRKCPLRHFLGPKRDQEQRVIPEKMKSGWEINRKFFFRPLFAIKNDFKGSFSTRRDP